MRWRGNRQSDNVEDRRGMSGGGKAIVGGGLIGIVMLFGLSASYTGSGDASFQNQLSSAGFQPDQVDSIHQILKEYRKSMLFNDAFRSLIFVLLSLGDFICTSREK